MILSWYINIYQAPQHFKTSRKTFEIMILLAISWYYHDILILSWYIKLSNPWTLIQMLANIWDYDITSDTLILSWYIKLSNPWTLSQMLANIWDYDITSDILILSWYCDIIMIYHYVSSPWTLGDWWCTGQHLRLWYWYHYFHIIMILWYYHDISSWSIIKIS